MKPDQQQQQQQQSEGPIKPHPKARRGTSGTMDALVKFSGDLESFVDRVKQHSVLISIRQQHLKAPARERLNEGDSTLASQGAGDEPQHVSALQGDEDKDIDNLLWGPFTSHLATDGLSSTTSKENCNTMIQQETAKSRRALKRLREDKEELTERIETLKARNSVLQAKLCASKNEAQSLVTAYEERWKNFMSDALNPNAPNQQLQSFLSDRALSLETNVQMLQGDQAKLSSECESARLLCCRAHRLAAAAAAQLRAALRAMELLRAQLVETRSQRNKLMAEQDVLRFETIASAATLSSMETMMKPSSNQTFTDKG